MIMRSGLALSRTRRRAPSRVFSAFDEDSLLPPSSPVEPRRQRVLSQVEAPVRHAPVVSALAGLSERPLARVPPWGDAAHPHVPQRVAKVLAQRCGCSRREAEALMALGVVSVDGCVVTLMGSRCAPAAVIEIARAGEQWLTAKVTIALHKPKGVVSTPRRRPTVVRRRRVSSRSRESVLESTVQELSMMVQIASALETYTDTAGRTNHKRPVTIVETHRQPARSV